MNGNESDYRCGLFDCSQLGRSDDEQLIGLGVDGGAHLVDWLTMTPSHDLAVLANRERVIAVAVFVKRHWTMVYEWVYAHLNVQSYH